MVSFQCNACGDVCTKPKLDKHYSQCHSSFDCIDCAKKFNSPAEYKGHTSCISEAEKYQGALYKGGKQNGHMGNGGRDNNWSRSWGGGTQQQHQGGGRPAYGRTYSRATGANETPLGTPVRMSPVAEVIPAPIPAPAVPDIAAAALKAQEEARPNKKRKLDEITGVVAEPQMEESKNKYKSKKSKDKKSKEDKTKAADLLPAVPENTAANTVDSTEAPVKKHKSKKSKAGAAVVEVPIGDSAEPPSKTKKSKSKSKGDVDVVMADTSPVEVAVAEIKPKRQKRHKEETEVDTGVTEKSEKKKKSKKEKRVIQEVKDDFSAMAIDTVPELPAAKNSKKSSAVAA